MSTSEDILDEAVAVDEATGTAGDAASAEESAPDAAAPEAPETPPDPLADGLAVTVSSDGLVAELALPPMKGAPTPDLEALVEELRSAHGLVDVDTDAVEALVAEALDSESKSTTAVVARGTEPIDGEDGTVEWLGDFFESQAIRLPNGAVDHYHHTKVSVYEGQPIVQLHPPTRGTPGRDVRGQTIKSEAGTEVDLEFDETVVRDPHDPSVLCAGRAGMVESYRGTVTVSEVQIVEAVDFATGSIDFEGAVQVRNAVAPKFSVVGTGAVIIGGPVENARVESRKTVTIEKGVLGKGDAVVVCSGDMSVGFAREAKIQCGGRFVAKKELLWCEGEVHGDLLVESGRIVGGHWRCGGRIVADELGSREEVTTILTLGEAAEQNRALRVLTRDRKKYQEQLVEFRRKYGPLLSGRIGKLDPKDRETLEHRLAMYERQASRSRKREYVLRKRLNIQRQASFVWVKSMIHAGTRLRMNGGKFVHQFQEPQPGPVGVRFDAETKTAVVEHIGLEDCATRTK